MLSTHNPTPDVHPPHNSTSTTSPAWPLEPALQLPNFIKKSPDTDQYYASVIFKTCAIDFQGVKEVLLVNREQCQNPLLLLEIPLSIWQEQNMLEDITRCLPWQPDLGPFPYQNLLKQGDLTYSEPALICPGQAVFNQEPPIFRPFTSERTSHILVKCTWQIPASALHTPRKPEFDPEHCKEDLRNLGNHIRNQICAMPTATTAYAYESTAGRFNDDYIDHMMEKHGALFYRRVASDFYGYGADYWIFPLPEP